MEGDTWRQAWQAIEPSKWTPSQLFDASTIAHQALWAITCDLSRQSLRWSGTDDPAGEAAEQFVVGVVRSAFVAGFAVWKTTKAGRLLVAHPDTTVVRCVDGEWAVESVLAPDWDDDKGWNVSVLYPPPVHVTTPAPWNWRSPLIASALLNERVAQMESNWLERDTHNSAPSAFTTVSGKLEGSGAGAGSLQWYKGNAVDAINLQGNDVEVADESFQQLLQNRADLITELEEHATMRRERIVTEASEGLLHDPRLSTKRRKVEHKEHAVSDGMEIREGKVLLSTIDGRFHYDRARHQLMLELGVPPQALGESVNSERAGSNAAQYEVAMTLFSRTVSRYRRFVDTVLEKATVTEGGKRIEYRPGVTKTQLIKLTPLLKPEKAVELYADVYELPTSFFDPERIAEASAADAKGRPGPGGGKQQSGVVEVPPVKGGTNRNKTE